MAKVLRIPRRRDEGRRNAPRQLPQGLRDRRPSPLRLVPFPASRVGCSQRDRGDHHQREHDDARVLRALVDDVPDHQGEACDRGDPIDGLTPGRQGAQELQPAHAAVASVERLTTPSPAWARIEGAGRPMWRPYLSDSRPRRICPAATPRRPPSPRSRPTVAERPAPASCKAGASRALSRVVQADLPPTESSSCPEPLGGADRPVDLRGPRSRSSNSTAGHRERVSEALASRS